MRIEVHHHFHFSPGEGLTELNAKLDQLLAELPRQERRHRMQMEKLDGLGEKLTALTTIGDGMEALLATLNAEIQNLKTGDPAQDAKVDALTAKVDSKISEWSTALAANTPAAPEPAPVTEPLPEV